MDKVLTDVEAKAFLSADVVVEEKIDGANLGFSVDDHGSLRAQGRGGYLDLDGMIGQWKPLARWLSTRRHALTDALAPNLVLFGEWCYAVHSVRYSQLPDWFLAFDVYDRATNEFWSVARRDELADALHVAVVPELGRGRFDISGLKRLLGSSRLSEGCAEGLYVRREATGCLISRAKLVRAEFVQTIEEHWSKRSVEPNQLAVCREPANG
jgi:ATP-dependent RNA circularization protein (DNA/RNA ligase family)